MSDSLHEISTLIDIIKVFMVCVTIIFFCGNGYFIAKGKFFHSNYRRFNRFDRR
jgi:hypothetical protein